MRSHVTALMAIGLVLLLATPALADNYGGNSRREQNQMVRLIHKRFGSGWVGRTMVCIAQRESGLNPRASNYRDSNGGSHGLFQINGIHAPGGYATRTWIRQMWNPKVNVERAWRLSRHGRSLGPWGGGC